MVMVIRPSIFSCLVGRSLKDEVATFCFRNLFSGGRKLKQGNAGGHCARDGSRLIFGVPTPLKQRPSLP